MTTLYRNLIGICRWMCELGRVDILLEVNLLSQYIVSPRIKHLRQRIIIFAYLKRHTRLWIVINPDLFEIDWVSINDEANPATRAKFLKSMNADSDDPDPPNMPTPLGESIHIISVCYANHAGNVITRRSQTGKYDPYSLDIQETKHFRVICFRIWIHYAQVGHRSY